MLLTQPVVIINCLIRFGTLHSRCVTGKLPGMTSGSFSICQEGRRTLAEGVGTMSAKGGERLPSSALVIALLGIPRYGLSQPAYLATNDRQQQILPQYN